MLTLSYINWIKIVSYYVCQSYIFAFVGLSITTINLQETQLLLTNRSTRLEVSQGHQTWYHSICYLWIPITVL